MNDEEKNRFIKIIKQKMMDILEAGNIKDPLAQYEYIEEGLLRIACFDDKKINKAILKYFEDQDSLKPRIKDKQLELQKPMDEYGENIKQIYELIKQL